MRRTSTVFAALFAAIAVAGCASTEKTTNAPKSSFAAATVTRTVTSPAAATVSTTTSAPKPKRKPAAQPQTFTGTASENLGSIKVSGPSTLSWQCSTCGDGNFIIGNGLDDGNQLDVNALDETSGSTYVDAGTYTDVSITTEGQAWTFTISPGNSTQDPTSNVTAEPATATQAGTPSVPATTPAPTAAADSPLDVVNDYWDAINSGAYATAWSDLAPGVGASSPASFVSTEEQDGVQGASFDGDVASLDGDSATVNVDSLITHDQTGCHSWTGTYQLSDESGPWQITQASITPHSCG